MFSELSVKKLSTIVLSLAWVDWVAYKGCNGHQCCPANCKVFLLYGVAPVVAVWAIYGICYYLTKGKEQPDENVEHVYIDQQ